MVWTWGTCKDKLSRRQHVEILVLYCAWSKQDYSKPSDERKTRTLHALNELTFENKIYQTLQAERLRVLADSGGGSLQGQGGVCDDISHAVDRQVQRLHSAQEPTIRAPGRRQSGQQVL